MDRFILLHLGILKIPVGLLYFLWPGMAACFFLTGSLKVRVVITIIYFIIFSPIVVLFYFVMAMAKSGVYP